ncbi:unnamed protein product [Linum trigynum]|uniref:Uncharacterized protein n=1 Tax=Linum trigynum TaxID=586398 RepID=A0AAV2FT32_9ROSI
MDPRIGVVEKWVELETLAFDGLYQWVVLETLASVVRLQWVWRQKVEKVFGLDFEHRHEHKLVILNHQLDDYQLQYPVLTWQEGFTTMRLGFVERMTMRSTDACN